MAIEVKQMIIKSTVVNEHANESSHVPAAIDIERLKEQLMEECKELIAESLSETRER